MPVYYLSKKRAFPPPHLADSDGLLAIGGDLSPERLLLAYSMGIFPWYNEGEPILWWSPTPRMVLYPSNLRIAKSMRPILNNKQIFQVSFDTDFEGVIKNCQKTARPEQSGTWITPAMLEAYCRLHTLGYAHSVEVRCPQTQELVGGLYGVSLGSCFFGESMFARQNNASKVGFIRLVEYLQSQHFSLIDCQVYTQHLASLGATLIEGNLFFTQLQQAVKKPTLRGKWTYLQS